MAKRGRPRKNPFGTDLKPPPAHDPEIDDLIGGKTGASIFEAPEKPPSSDLREVLGGVSLNWLSKVFRMDTVTVKKRLAQCPVLREYRGSPLFDAAAAASFLVKPKGDMTEYIKRLRPVDLPPMLQGEYWDAMLKRQKWEANAGELWRTESVLDVFADTFKMLKETMRLWPDTIERAKGLTNEQRQTLMGLVDTLQDDLHQKLVELPKLRQTSNQKAEIEEEAPKEPTDGV